MPTRLLIDASVGETRRALVEDGRVVELDVERGGELGEAVFLARVTAVAPETDAAFLDLGDGRSGFLDFRRARVLADEPRSIADCVHEGQSLLVQARGAAAPEAGKALPVAAGLKLVGRYCLVEPRRKGLSFARALEEDRRGTLGAALAPVAAEAAVTVRSAAAAVAVETVVAEAASLLGRARAIAAATAGPRLLLPAPSLLERSLRDAPAGLVEILLGDSALLGPARRFAERWPDLDTIALWREDTPLFEAFGAEDALERVLTGVVALASGGRITVEATQAATVIDVDAGPGRDRRRTNREAAQAAARHLRLAGIGGLVLIDFIDPAGKAERAQVLAALDAALADDPAPLQRAQMTGFGVVALTRGAGGPSLPERLLERAAPRPSLETAALDLLRRAERTAARDRRPGTLVLSVSATLADWLAARPALLEALGQRSGRAVRVDAAPARDHLHSDIGIET